MGKYRVETVGLTREPVESMGGIRVLPSKAIGEVDPADVAVFIIPGGDRWEKGPIEPEIAGLLNRLDHEQVSIAAICAGTTVVAKQGLLRGRKHTSNALDYLRAKVPGYSEANGYVDAPAVRDRGLITASGLGDVEFARELFEELEVLRPQDRAAWAQIFRSGRMPQAKA